MKKTIINNFATRKKQGNFNVLEDKILLLIDKGFADDSDRELICSYCRMVINNITYTEKEQRIYNFYINNILKDFDLNEKLTNEDVIVIFQYLAFDEIKKLGLNVNYEVLSDNMYALKSLWKGCNYTINEDGSYTIYLSNSVFDVIAKDNNFFDKEKLVTNLESLYRDIIRIYQYEIIRNQLHRGIEDKNVLMWIKENMLEEKMKIYYLKLSNVKSFERDAAVKSKFMTIDTLFECFRYFGLSFITSKEMEAQDYKYDVRNIIHVDPKTGDSANAEEIIDKYIDILALKNPMYVYDRLSIQYNAAGQRRNPFQLESEYERRLEQLKQEYNETDTRYWQKLESLRELYEYLIEDAKGKEVITTSYVNKNKNK